MDGQVRKILSEQLELLAEASKRKGLSAMDLRDLSMAMVAISGEMKDLHCVNASPFEPDKYELQPASKTPVQEH